VRTHQPIDSNEVRDHEHWHVENRDRICGTQLPRQRRKAEPDRVVIIEEDVDRPDEIEGDDEQPKERTYPHRKKGQHGQDPVAKSP